MIEYGCFEITSDGSFGAVVHGLGVLDSAIVVVVVECYCELCLCNIVVISEEVVSCKGWYVVVWVCRSIWVWCSPIDFPGAYV